MDKFFKNKKVLITGHTGFKGTWMSTWLLEMGAEVHGISKDIPTSPSMFDELGLAAKMSHTIGDVRDLELVIDLVNRIQPDYLFHLAAQPIVSLSYLNPIETITSNVLGTANILEALRITNHDCVALIITSDKCYDNVEWVWGYKETDQIGGKDIYSGSKGGAELIFKAYYHSFFSKDISNIRIASARAGNVIGGGDWAKDRVIPDCMRAWACDIAVEIRCPTATRPWQHVLEPISGYLNLAAELKQRAELNGESFNFGPNSNDNYSVEKLIRDLSRTWEISESDNLVNITGSLQFHEASLLKLNCDKALHHLKWNANLVYDELLEYTGLWYYNFYKNNADMYEFTRSQISDFIKIAKRKGLNWTKL